MTLVTAEPQSYLALAADFSQTLAELNLLKFLIVVLSHPLGGAAAHVGLETCDVLAL